MNADTGKPAGRAAGAIDRIAAGIARHWLAVFNLVVGLFIGLPFLAPVLMQAGATGPAELIYRIYAPTCHQLPERSFFLFGHEHVYSLAGLEQMGALPAGLNIFQRQLLRFPGDAETGFKVALCQRDIGIYGSILLTSLLFGLLRPRLMAGGRKLPKMNWRIYLLFLIPALLDGGTQLFGWRESTWLLRLITGSLFGAATVWFAYPHVQDAMDDVLRTTEASAKAHPETGQKYSTEV